MSLRHVLSVTALALACAGVHAQPSSAVERERHGNRVSEKAEEAKDWAKEKVNKMRNRADEAADEAENRAEEAREDAKAKADDCNCP